MGFSLIVKPEAELDLFDALAWYEEQRTGFGTELFLEISHLLDDIALHPQQYQERYRNVRIRFTKRFRYGIHYIVEGEIISILAILHTSRNPRK